MPIDEIAAHYSGMAVTRHGALERAFEEQVRGCADLAVRVAFSVLRQREDAEEAAQEAFARACTRFHELQEPERFRAWIVRVTWRIAIDRWRADRRRQAREQAIGEAAAASSAEQLAMDAERSSRLWNAVDELPEKLRIVIILNALEGHGVAEVAQLLGIPPGTVKSRLFLARRALAQRLTCLANDSATR